MDVDTVFDPVAAVDAAIAGRHSVRRFLDTPVPRETVETLLAVASRAPSGTNMQPWKVSVVAGAVRQELQDALLAAYDARESGHASEIPYYPKEFPEPYRTRRRTVGWALYGLLGIARGEKEKMHAQQGRNYRFFDAPVGMIFTIDRALAIGSWLDYGMFLQNVMVAARARGLDTCPQMSFARYHRIIRRVLGIPDDEMVICGMALGYADPEAPENRLVTERAPVSGFARIAGFPEPSGGA